MTTTATPAPESAWNCWTETWVRAPIGIAHGDGTDRLGQPDLILRLHERVWVRT